MTEAAPISCESSVICRIGQALLTAEQGNAFPSSVLSPRQFLPTGLTKESFHTLDLEITLIWAIQARHLKKHEILS